MQTYSTFQPTAFDRAGAGKYGAMAERQDWLVVPVTQTRDSGVLDRSNFRSYLKALGGESDTVEVHRFSHWGPGWFEIIIIDPTDTAKVETAQEIADALEDYPIVDEDNYSELEYEGACNYWAQMPIRERVQYIQEARDRTRGHMSIFAARRDELPEDPAGRLYEALTRE